MSAVLLVASGFPPEAGGGVIRVTKLAKYLPSFGWTPVVLTAQPPFLPGSIDYSMDAAAVVYRAPRCDVTVWAVHVRDALRKFMSPRSANHGRLEGAGGGSSTTGRDGARRRLSEYVLVPDDRVIWIPGAVLLGLVAICRHRPRVIYSMSPSPTALIVGHILGGLARVPWIVEFRDPWTLNPFRRPRPFGWMEKAELWLEKIVVCGAAHIVVTSPQYKRDLLNRYKSLMERDITCVPNGFDPEDFENVAAMKFEKTTILHAGNFYGARSSLPFLLALRRVLGRQPDLRRSIQVVFLGGKNADTEYALAELGLCDVVKQIGSVSHAQSIEYILGADILLLMPGPGDGTMPGKVYEYLAAQKPVLAVADDGVVKEFINSSGIGLVAAVEDTESIAAALSRMIKAVGQESEIRPDIAGIRDKFDRKAIAGRIAEILIRTSDARNGNAL